MALVAAIVPVALPHCQSRFGWAEESGMLGHPTFRFEHVDHGNHTQLAPVPCGIPILLHRVAAGHHYEFMVKLAIALGALYVKPELSVPVFGSKFPSIEFHFCAIEPTGDCLWRDHLCHGAVP